MKFKWYRFFKNSSIVISSRRNLKTVQNLHLSRKKYAKIRMSEFKVSSLHDKLNFYGRFLMNISNDSILKIIDYKVKQNMLILIKESYEKL